MIITSVKHGRTARDGFNLMRHLMKPENDYVDVADIGNSLAPDIFELVRDLELYRDASPSTAAFHHLTINPVHRLDRPHLLAAVEKVRLELDPEGLRPYAIVVHGKQRAEPGGASEHAHLVVGHVNAAGKALNDSWIKVRTERVARELEFSFGEPPTLGRHHRSVLKVLRKTAPEVAVWLTNSFGLEPPKPNASLTPTARNRALQHGVNLPAAKAAIRQLLTKSNGWQDFQLSLEGAGYSIQPGQKLGVHVICDVNGYVLGAADRLLKMRRAELRAMMEFPVEHTSRPDPAYGSPPRAATLQPGPPDRPEVKPPPAAAGFDWRYGAGGWGGGELGPGPRPNYSGRIGAGDRAANVTRSRVAESRPEAVPRPSAFARRRALMQLRRGNAAQLALMLSLRPPENPVAPNFEPPDPSLAKTDYVARTDIWGVGILRPR